MTSDELDVGRTSSRVDVDQAPPWLADVIEVMIEPPGWVAPVLVAIAVAVIALAALGYHRNGGLDREVLEEMGQIGTIVILILICAQLWIRVFDFGYVINVLGSTAVGYGLARYFIWAFRRAREDRLPTAES